MDPPSLAAAMRGVEVVIHCGAQVGGWQDRDAMVASHVVGTEHILRAVSEAGVRRLIYTSSVAALGVAQPAVSERPPALIDESQQWNYDPDEWPYGYAKHCAEQRVLDSYRAGLDALIVNPAAVIGPGDKNLVASAIIYHMGRGLRPPIPPGGLNVVHVDDVVSGYLAAIERGRSGERYILGGENIRYEDFLQLIAGAIGIRPLKVRLPGWAFSGLAGIIDRLQPRLNLPVRGHIFRLVGRYFYYDISRMREKLLVTPVRSAAEAILAAHEWYRAHPEHIRAASD